MGTVTILEETTKNPITLIGKRAGVCWGGNISDDEKNYKRGMDCILSNHGRTLEYVNVEMIIDGYSARVMREFYTHIAGAPCRLQASTRYINYENLEVIKPYTINSFEKEIIWYDCIEKIRESYKRLEELEVPKEDIAMLLPLGMTTKIVDKRNLRSLVDMSHQRMCSRAYWEYRLLFNDICKALSEVSDEWKWIVDNLFKPKCELFGYCPEKKSCGRKFKEDDK